MAENWSSFKPSIPFSEEILAASQTVTETLATLQSFLDIIKELLELAKLLSSLIASNPIEAALRALIDQIQQFLDDILQRTGVHAIFIPIQKQSNLGTDLLARAIADPDKIENFDDLLDDEKFPGATEVEDDAISFINDSSTATGGNTGFYKVLRESIRDEGDPNRPIFPDNFAVAGGALVFGSNDLKELYKIFELLDSLFKLGTRSDLSGHTKPTLQNLRARALPITSSSPARIGVQLDWDKTSPTITFPSFTEDQYVIEEILIIRSEDPKFRSRFTWSQSFSRQPAFDDKTDVLEGEDEDTKVIARLQNDGLIFRYVDTDPELVEGRIYYYAAALIVTAEATGDDETDIIFPVGNMSNVVRVEFLRPRDAKGGEPPDWVATPSLASLFPALEALINEIRLVIADLLSRTVTGPNQIDQLIRLIETIIARSERVIRILDRINRLLTALLTSDVGGISATVYTIEDGGMDAWTSELARRLSDRGDPTRPAFDGSELVGGAVLVAGAPNLPLLEPFFALLQIFFGSGTDNPLLDAVNTLDSAVTETEKTVFGEDMAAEQVPVGTPDPEEPQVVFDENMNPTDTVNCN